MRSGVDGNGNRPNPLAWRFSSRKARCHPLSANFEGTVENLPHWSKKSENIQGLRTDLFKFALNCSRSGVFALA
jgi:hypothetical protein